MNAEWQNTLIRVINEMKSGKRPKSLSVPVLRTIVHAPSSEELAQYAVRLAANQELKIQYRILSPDTKNTIAEYDHLYEVPKRIFDEDSDSYVSVVPSRDIEIVYSVPEV